MKRVITLQNQHFLKKNYTYNFFRSSIRFTTFFLKNSLFLFKFYRLFKFFFFINFFLQKKMIFNKFGLSLPRKNNSILLKNKFFSGKYDNLYGQNYVLFCNTPTPSLAKISPNIDVINVNANVINYNNISILNYNQLFSLLMISNIK